MRSTAERATALVRGRNPFWGFGAESNSYSGCKNEQQADFEVELENRITDT